MCHNVWFEKEWSIVVDEGLTVIVTVVEESSLEGLKRRRHERTKREGGR